MLCLPFFGSSKPKPQGNKVKDKPLTILKELKKSTFPVYLAHSHTLNTPIAVKVFPIESAQPHPSYFRELVVQQLCHPNIIKVHESCEFVSQFCKEEKEPVAYILMELAPFGTFFDLIWRKGLPINESLTRTYFHQLIDGVDYLHSNYIAHTDLKPENLMLGDQYILKIIDFERSKKGTIGKIPGRGTKNYRAPEVKNKECEDPKSADVYSAGVILFVLMSHFHPYLEDKEVKGFDLQKLMLENNEFYWDALIECKGDVENLSQDFKDLFFGMVRLSPLERWTLEEVKRSVWYNGPVLSQKELKIIMAKTIKEKISVK
jgi:5'-AMP-activated protein kinase catalytic alpha subunit